MTDGPVALRAPVSAGRSGGNLCETDRTSEAEVGGWNGGLSVRVARELLGDAACALSDDDIGLIRDGMYALAVIVLEATSLDTEGVPGGPECHEP